MVFSLDFFPFFKATFSKSMHLIKELKNYKKHEKNEFNDEIFTSIYRTVYGRL